MPSATEMSRSDIGRPKVLLIAVIAVAAATFIPWLAHIGAEARAAIEQQQMSDMAAESRALCEKWGMPAGTPKHVECTADIQAIRDRHEKRITADDGLF